MSLDRYQTEAVEFNKGPALVIAGPGSGKTTVLTRRVAYLIKEHLVSPDKILVITFTKSAASQMKERFRSISDDYNPVTFCTFHSLFYTIIKESEYNHYSVVSPEEKLNIVKRCMIDNNMDIDTLNISGIIDEFAQINNGCLNIVDFESKYLAKDLFIKLYLEFKREKNSLGLIEYDDFSIIVNKILTKETMLVKWQKMYDYVLIDEFQDVNLTQYNIINKLFVNGNIYAVGDEDQSIYGFRGSSPDICFKFMKDYNAKRFDLVNNYRSKRIIVEMSSRLIKHNKNRFDKNFNAFNVKKGEFTLFKGQDIKSIYDEMCINIINQLKMNRSVVILTRTNVMPEGLYKCLNKYGIKLKNNGNKVRVKEEIINGILAYFRLSNKDKSIKDILTIANKPDRYISRTFINMVSNETSGIFDFTTAFKLAKGKGYLVKSLFLLERNLIEISKMDSYEAIIYIMKVIGFEKYLKDKKIEYEKDLLTIKAYAREFRDKDEFVENINLINNFDISSDGEIEVRTMHSSKGLEWDSVFITELQEGQMPHKKCVNRDEIEEERRLLYVGMTRAKESLWLGYAQDESLGVKPSIFVKELL